MSEVPSYTVGFFYRKILISVDWSEISLKALLVDVDFAYRHGSRIVVLCAKPRGIRVDDDSPMKTKERLRDIPVNATYRYLEYDPVDESP